MHGGAAGRQEGGEVSVREVVTVVWHSLRGEQEPKDLDHSLGESRSIKAMIMKG